MLAPSVDVIVSPFSRRAAPSSGITIAASQEAAMGDDGAGCCPRRVARPPRHRYAPSSKEHCEARSGLLSKIESSYTEAQHRLAVRGRPVTLSRFLDAGVCIGLLDPVSNIMIPLRPYLAEWESMRYLLLADADLLCAASTIVADRGMMLHFSLNSPASAPAVEAALALAAQVSKHPQPKQLALARLPRGELRSHLHRSLLRAGHCYGPMDPAVTPVLDVIGLDSLTRLQSRSFYGLVSFIQTRYHHLSEHQSVQCLIAACGQLSLADPKLMSTAEQSKGEQRHHCMWNHYDEVIRSVEQQSPCAGVQEAYMAADIAAWHPNPDEQATFLASWKGDPVVMNQLTSEDVHHWSQFMSPEQTPTPERVCKSGYPVVAGKMRSEVQQRRVSRKKPAYDLHIISCVNKNVGGPEYCEEQIAEDCLSFAPCRYLYTHVNFLATRKDSLSNTSYTTLFFAEFDNKKKDGAPLVCCPVHEPIAFAAEHVRCLYCEAAGARVVHPTSMEFHGGGEEFEKVIHGEHSLSNSWLICKNNFAVERMCAVEEDFMYVDVNETE
ncbi:unnamed protein product [Miscanthus lutarioriparius]|uniref:Uncharacterized protein n=1 Tax=Miscanthus lutarioriparius TaxID=422564 RepID=A0A811QFY5_9POAL|nr:unnamed protein product [Miscanthus lutarioriparius]